MEKKFLGKKTIEEIEAMAQKIFLQPDLKEWGSLDRMRLFSELKNVASSGHLELVLRDKGI